MGILRWLRPWHHRRELDEDLARELETHLAVAREEQIARGLSPVAAGPAAQRQLGSITYVKEEMREMWGWMWLERFVQDVQYGVRFDNDSAGGEFAYSWAAICSEN